jgi:hypothetical protein
MVACILSEFKGRCGAVRCGFAVARRRSPFPTAQRGPNKRVWVD